ncbi:hypothetical protein KUV95_12945 [Microbulbifer agarilyticus]|uniref:hypothetical protein n=1 Tax=Microbulbifer agarilyticus TaxID=260552 RepID=UPI001C954104|nr:hypothetical protein [Microbulbifer agarilyticus]MBY6212458.1 hypothetical protein [Microbulbifer agarilyticus]
MPVRAVSNTRRSVWQSRVARLPTRGGKARNILGYTENTWTVIAIHKENHRQRLAKDFPAKPKSSVDIDNTPGNRQERTRTTLQGEKFRAESSAAENCMTANDGSSHVDIELVEFCVAQNSSSQANM